MPLPPVDDGRADGSDRLRLGVEAGALVALQLVLLAGFWRHLDLHVSDEVHYYRRGLEALGGHLAGAFEKGPALAFLYAPVIAACGGAVQAMDAVYALAAVASTLALWWALRAVLPGPAALLAAAWWAGSDLVLSTGRELMHTSVYAYGAAWGSLGLGFLLRRSYGAGLAALWIAAFARAESAVWILGLAAVYGLLRLGGRGPGRRVVVAFALVGLASTSLVRLNPGTRVRSFGAFRQGFAAGLVERGEATTGSKAELVNRSRRVVDAHFPGATTLVGALQTNPRAFLEHVAHNATLVPRGLRKLAADAFTWTPGWRRALLVATAGLGALGLVALARGRRVHGAAGAPSWDAERLAVRASGVAVVAAMVVVRPRTGYLTPLAPLLLAVPAALAAAGWSALGPARRLPPALGRFGGALALALLAVLVPRPYAGEPVRPGDGATRLPHRRAVALLTEHAIEPGTLLAKKSRSLALLAAPELLEPVDLTELWQASGRRPQPFRELVERFEPDYVLFTPELAAFGARPGEMAAELGSERWRAVARDGGLVLYRRAAAAPR